MVPFLDVAAATAECRAEIDAAIARVVDSGRYILGEEVAAFEAEFADYCGTSHCVGVGNGLDALHLSLRALGIGRGDEVIVASNTFIATWLAVTMAGATPVPVEPDLRRHNMNVDGVERALTDRTRAIMPTHLYGQPAELEALMGLARRHGLFMVEDAAQAHGARYAGRRIGGHGDLVCWSFYPGKNLGALGDAGAVTTDDSELAQRVRVLANYGSTTKYVNPVKGVNSRLDPIQAAILRVKLKRLDEWNARRSEIAGFYLRELAAAELTLPAVADRAEPVWHLFVIQHADRDALQQAMRQRGVETLVHYPIPPHLQGAYADGGFEQGSLPIAEALARQALSLPIGPHLTLEQAQSVVAAVLDSMPAP